MVNSDFGYAMRVAQPADIDAVSTVLIASYSGL